MYRHPTSPARSESGAANSSEAREAPEEIEEEIEQPTATRDKQRKSKTDESLHKFARCLSCLINCARLAVYLFPVGLLLL